MLNNTGNVFGLLYTAGRRSPQENLIEARGASSGVSDRLVSAGNTVVNFSSGGVAGGLARGGRNDLDGIKVDSCERRSINENVHFLPSTNCAHTTLEEIAIKCGVNVSGLEAYLKKGMKEFSAEMAETNCSDNKKYSPLIDQIFNLYVLAGGNNNLLPWMDKLRDFDVFIGHFCPEANNRSRAGIMRHIKTFCHTSKVLVKNESYSPIYLYYVQGEGLRELPKRWVTLSVPEEVKKLMEEDKYPFRIDNRIHATGSAALENIGKAGAILSARESLKSNYKIKTGEYVEYVGRDGFSCSGGKKGLTQIFTSTNNFSSMDAGTQRWFDEFSVGFCIDVEKQNDYNMQNGLELSINKFNFSGEGIVVGPKVPLENVTAISAPKANEKQVQEWIDQYCPWALFISKEAARVIEGRR